MSEDKKLIGKPHAMVMLMIIEINGKLSALDRSPEDAAEWAAYEKCIALVAVFVHNLFKAQSLALEARRDVGATLPALDEAHVKALERARDLLRRQAIQNMNTRESLDLENCANVVEELREIVLDYIAQEKEALP